MLGFKNIFASPSDAPKSECDERDPIDLVTADEVRRRVTIALDTAISQRDFEFLSAVALFAETKRLLSDTSVKFTFDSPARLKQLLSWARQHYGDMMGDSHLHMQCARNAAAQDVAAASRLFAAAADLSVMDLKPPTFLPERTDGTIAAVLSLSGRGIGSVFRALDVRLRAQAQAFGAGRGDLATRTDKDVLSIFLSTVLSTCAECRPVEQTSPTERSASVPPPTAAPVPLPKPAQIPVSNEPDVYDVVRQRVQSVTRSLGCADRAPDALDLQRAMRGFAKKGDSLGVASVALLMWQQRVVLKQVAYLSKFELEENRPPPATAAARANSGPPPVEDEIVTSKELAGYIKYDERTIRDRLTKTVFQEGVHFSRRGRKLLFLRDKCIAQITGFAPSKASAA